MLLNYAKLNQHRLGSFTGENVAAIDSNLQLPLLVFQFSYRQLLSSGYKLKTLIMTLTSI